MTEEFSMHTLVAFGCVGQFHCYLDVPEHEAWERYLKEMISEGYKVEEIPNVCIKFQFKDSFHAYDIGVLDGATEVKRMPLFPLKKEVEEARS